MSCIPISPNNNIMYPPFFICPPSQHKMYCCLFGIPLQVIMLAVVWYHSPPTNKVPLWAYCIWLQCIVVSILIPMAMAWLQWRRGKWYQLHGARAVVVVNCCVRANPQLIPNIRRCTINDGGRVIIIIVLLILLVVVVLLFVSVCIMWNKRDRNIRRWWHQHNNKTNVHTTRTRQQWQWHCRVVNNSTMAITALMRWRHSCHGRQGININYATRCSAMDGG